MRVRGRFDDPPEKRQQRRRAVRLERWTLAWMASVIAVVGLTMGGSQAMKAAWIEDLLSLVPPLAFLVAARVHDRPPDARFPYGYQRAFSISFLIAAAALFGFGAFILLDSLLALVRQEHPTIGLMRLFGVDVWAGWPMIAALAYSAVPPVILGRMKLPLSRQLHDKTLHADAAMNKADWMTALAGILGILGIAVGWWWADPVAAGLISFAILKDGVDNLRNVIGDLMDRRPVTVDHADPDDVEERVVEALERLPWVAGAEVRLREEGELLDGELFLVVRDEALGDDEDGPDGRAATLAARFAEAQEAANRAHWRIHDVIATAVPGLQREEGEQARESNSR
jgi:cation diffusion facilitator family transporter